MQIKEIEVTRIYIAFGYFLEWYESVDGGRADSGLSEVWVGKDDIEYKTFVFQCDFSKYSKLNKWFLLQSVFSSAICDFNSQFEFDDDLEVSDLDGCGQRKVTYTIKRYYFDDGFYLDEDSLDLYDEHGMNNIWFGKIGCLLKGFICICDTSYCSLEDAEEALSEFAQIGKENYVDLFEESYEELNIDDMKMIELSEELGIYSDLGGNGIDNSIIDDSSDDTIKFD